MTAPRWRMVWTWAGVTGEAYVSPDFAQRSDLYSPGGDDTSVTVRFVPRQIRSVAAVVNGGIPLYTGSADLYYGDVLVTSGRWSTESSYGRDGDPIEVVITESWEDDGAAWPPLGGLRRPGADVIGDEVAGLRPGIVSRRTWPLSVYAAGQGEGYPVIFGTPGTSTIPGAPAPVIADASATSIGVMVHAGALTGDLLLWGPQRSSDADAMISVSVTPSSTSDTLGCVVSQVSFNSGAVGYPGWSSTGARYYTSWTGTARGLPSGGGDLLVAALESSALRCDVDAARAMRGVLNRYRLDGFSNDLVGPAEWAKRQLGAILPFTLTQGPRGLTPVLWPWLDSVTDSRWHLHEGPGFVGGPTVTYTGGGGASLVRVLHSYCPATGEYTGEASASSRDQLRGRVAASLLGGRGRLQTVETRLIWDVATAERVARDRLLVGGTPRRTIAYQCDPGVYGAGGRFELRVGLPFILTDDRLSLSRAPAVVRRIERAGERMRVDVDLRDDGLRPAG